MGMRRLLERLEEEQPHPSLVSKVALTGVSHGKSNLSKSDLKGLKDDWDKAFDDWQIGIADYQKLRPKIEKIKNATRGRLVYVLNKSDIDKLGMTTKEIKELAVEHATAFGKFRRGANAIAMIWRKIENSISNVADLRKSAGDQGYYSFKADVTIGSDVGAMWAELTKSDPQKYDVSTYRDGWRTTDSFRDTAFYGASYVCGMLDKAKTEKCVAGTMNKKFYSDFKEWEAELG